MVKKEVLNRQTVCYDMVYFLDDSRDCMRSIFDYDCIYNIDKFLGTYRFGEWIVTDIYDSYAVWHDGDVIGEETFLVKIVKGVTV